MIITMNTKTITKGTEMDTNRNFTIPPSLIQEADELSKTTRISFRDCLEILMKSLLSEKKDKIDREELGEVRGSP